MKDLPPGDLLASRVRTDPATVLEDALDRRLTGYARLEPRTALLGDGHTGVLVFEEGVPTLAYHAEEGVGGTEAVAALATPGPCRAELYAVPRAALPGATPEFRVPPDVPAERLAGDRDLAARTRRLAPDYDGDADSAVEAFLADEAKIEAIREQAREEAERRAEEWGFESALE